MATYDITGSVKESGDGKPFTDAFYDGNGNPADGLEAIFPIFEYNEGNFWKPVGTGFFIAEHGLFATAKHVLVDAASGAARQDLLAAHIIRRQQKFSIRRVINITLHPKADVAIGFLADEDKKDCASAAANTIFRLSADDPILGDKIAAMAFPNATVQGSADAFMMEFKTLGVSGKIVEVYPHGRDQTLLPSKCFQSDMNIAGGASGGPVAFGAGHVFGINSTGYDGHPDINFISSVTDLLDLKTNPISLPDGTTLSRVAVGELINRPITGS